MRRSEEPPPTEVVCYWKKSKLSTALGSIKFREAQNDFGDHRSQKQHKKIVVIEGSFRKKVMDISVTKNSSSVISRYFKPQPEVSIMLIDQMVSKYKLKAKPKSPDFIKFCSSIMTARLCIKAYNDSKEQANSFLWYHLRYGRITASKFYEAAHCTTDGVLVESILGGMTFKSLAMERGQRLEIEVRNLLRNEFPDIKECGLMLRFDLPIFGASPDGINDEYVFEIKCPMKKTTVTNYLKNGIVQPKFMGQIQLQMLMSGRKKGVFCVASPDFEVTKKISKVFVDLDLNLCNDYIEKCKFFWFQYVFPKLIQ